MTTGSPADLAALLLNGNGTSVIQTNLDQEDNEMVTQVLFSSFQTLVTNPILNIGGVLGLNDIIDGIRVGFASMGYLMRVEQIVPSELKNYIYYSRLTPDGQLLLSNYHPINLMKFMEPGQIPESFQKLFSDQDYLPNIVNVWDRGNNDSLLLITFQKLNIHF